MKERYIVLTIDTIAELFKDYLDPEDLPDSAVPMRLLFKPTEQGRMALEMFSLDWAEGLGPLVVNFDIKRTFQLGAPSGIAQS